MDCMKGAKASSALISVAGLNLYQTYTDRQFCSFAPLRDSRVMERCETAEIHTDSCQAKTVLGLLFRVLIVVFILIQIGYHVQARLALSTVLRPLLVSYGRPPNLTPCSTKTTVTIERKLYMIDYVAETSE